MRFFINGILTSKEKLLKWVSNPKTKLHKLTIEMDNPNRSDDPPTMEGFEIPKDYLISMAEKSNQMNAKVTATFHNCGKLGGKTLTITVS